ncbi:MAG: hypothetical protein N4A47_03500 [Clostridia bacterium]|nr:hypothetical protein [Clostridia bacterium]
MESAIDIFKKYYSYIILLIIIYSFSLGTLRNQDSLIIIPAIWCVLESFLILKNKEDKWQINYIRGVFYLGITLSIEYILVCFMHYYGIIRIEMLLILLGLIMMSLSTVIYRYKYNVLRFLGITGIILGILISQGSYDGYGSIMRNPMDKDGYTYNLEENIILWANYGTLVNGIVLIGASVIKERKARSN